MISLRLIQLETLVSCSDCSYQQFETGHEKDSVMTEGGWGTAQASGLDASKV